MSTPARFRLRLLVLPVAAAMIIGAVIYGEHHSDQTPRPTTSAESTMQAPLFEGSDARRSLFRLQSWLSRHRILLVFFDGEAGAKADPVLSHLLEHAAELRQTNTYVAAVSTALPSQNALLDFPATFALVTDLPPAYGIHRQWNCLDEATGELVHSVFLIDQTGNVQERNGKPVPLSNVDHEIDRLLGTSHR